MHNMAKAAYKYNLNHRYSLLPKSITLDELINLLEKAGIPQRTFYRDRAILANEQTDIPGERLMIYAKVFACELSELINYTVKAKPIVPSLQKFKSPLS
jgi:hypothetical protein